jgi:hypothetical protein
MRLKVREGFMGTWERVGTSDEDAINAVACQGK